MRLNKFISAHTQYSRRKADELIEAGKICINNKKISELGTQIDPEKDIITVENIKIEPQSEKIYIALNKPAGYVTTRKDEFNRKTVMDLLPEIPNLKPVGRLDKDSEGLLLFSNDGDFINLITHPKFKCKKEYFVEIKGKLKQQKKEMLEKGIILEGKKTAPTKIKIKEITSKKTTLTIELHEGRKRQIRKMFALIRHHVEYLQRIRIGKIKLGSLKIGKHKNLTKAEVNDYKST